MNGVRPMDSKIKEKIMMYIKNGQDISDLIEGYSLKDANLANAKISRLVRINEDISNASFVNCQFGNTGETINFSGSKMIGVNFKRAKFFSIVWFNQCDLTGANFNHAYLPKAQYRYANLSNITVCETVIKLGSKCGMGAKLDLHNLFDLWTKYIQVTVPTRKEEPKWKTRHNQV